MSEQTRLGIQADKRLETIDSYEFEPIKGYPMLRWKGKRPFTATQYYPAQHKENHGQEVDGWMNRIYWGDNLQVMSHLLKEFRGKVDLIYIDPPFDSKADYKKKVSIKGKNATGDQSTFEEKQYTDVWSNDDYLQFIYERAILMRELLSETGSIYVHCDYHKNYLIRTLLDEIFGNDNFVNEIIWKRTTAHGDAKQGAKRYDIVHDTILMYSKSKKFLWNTQYIQFSDDQIAQQYNKTDEEGRKYRLVTPTASKPGGDTMYEFRGVYPPKGRYWAYKKEKLEEMDQDGKLYFSSSGQPYIKYYLDERPGVAASTLWYDVSTLAPTSSERIGYPTQKPEQLIERIVKASSNPGDLVFDCFMGSGTTQAVAMKLGRRFIGADINLGAVQTTTKRLIIVAYEIKQKPPELDLPTDSDHEKPANFYTGFSIYNVNHYDVFRNPLEAKELLIQALEIQPLPNNGTYDGEKDGKMVKIMPFDRIATRADLTPLISGLNYRALEKKQQENPGKALEHILLVCMGHEPDLAAVLQKEVPFKIDVQVVDILRDKANLEFKRDAEAEIVIKNGQLTIEAFYPMNLLQKLSLMKENVEDWRELTESVMIDFNYDEVVFEPSVVDIPGKDELVRGAYSIPDDAGTIRVKITDLLSESLDTTVH